MSSRDAFFCSILLGVHVLGLNAQSVRPRALADLPDDSNGYQIHLLYVVPADGEDRGLDVDGTLEQSVASFQQWLSSRSGGRSLRLDTAGGKPDISFVRLRQSAADIALTGAFSRQSIEAEIVASGFDDPKKFYAVYFDGAAADSCADSPWPPDTMGSTAILYLRGSTCESTSFVQLGAPPGYRELVMLHQLFHGFGFVARCAPDQSMSGHLSGDDADLMANEAAASWNPSNLDARHTDYFAHNNAGCLDLSRSVFLDGGSPSDVPPPSWPLTLATSQNCSQESSLRSAVSTTPAMLNFLNTTGRPVAFHWLDQNGARSLSRTLLPWQSVQQGTYQGGEWLVSETNGTCLAIFSAVAGYQRALVRAGQMSVTPGGLGESFSVQPGLAPGTWVSLFGNGFASGTASWSPVADQALPIGLGSTTVLVNGRLAPVSFVSPGQINFLVPADTPPGDVTIEVRNGPDRVSFTAQAAATLPALYGVPEQTATGINYWVTAVVPGGPGQSPIFVGNSALDTRVTRGARVGDLLELYAIGLGPTNPPVPTDRPFQGSAPLRDPVHVFFGAEEGQVQFAGLVATGLYQINVVIPPTVGAGNVRLTVTAGGITSRKDVFLKVE